MNFENKKCLILGGAGFIGMNLSLFLKEKGMNVSVLDTLSNSYIQAEQTLVENNIEFFHANSLDIGYMINVLKDFHYVINLTSTDIVDDGFTRQEELSDSSILSTQILLQAATHHNINRIILMSNLHVYGETKPYRSKCKENMKDLQPNCPLGSIKLSEETIAKTLAKAYGQKITILRLSECYGPFIKTHMPYGLFSSISYACLTGTECTLPNDGLDGRDYIYVEDVCNYVGKILLNDNNNNIIETYNVCSGKEKTYKELFDIMNKYYKINGSKIKNRMVLYPFSGHIVGDNSKINKDFGKIETSFDKSIKNTLEWIKKQFEEQQKMIDNSKELIQQSLK